MINYLPFLFVCIIIGLPCYFTGCEDTIQPNCSRYWIKTTYVASYGARTHRCKRCIHSTRTCKTNSNGKQHCEEKCDTYYYYDGYDIEYYDHNNKQYACNFYAGRNLLTRDVAIQSAKSEYPIGTNYDRYINKMTKECYTATGIVALAITGFIFLFLASISLCMII